MNGIKAGKRAALVACLIVCGAAGAASAAVPPAPEALVLSALKGDRTEPTGDATELSIEAPAGIAAFEHVHIEIRAAEGTDDRQNRIINLTDVAAPDGIATIELGPAGRGAAVSVDAQIREQNPPRTVIHRGETVVKLRPDLVVAAVYAPPQTLSTQGIDVLADLSELNLETGAKATVELKLGPTPIAEPQTVTVPRGGSMSIVFEDVRLTTPMSAELTVLISGAAPFETDESNNSRSTRVEVTEHELVRSNVLLDALGGYGAQFNQHVYASITPKPPDSMPDLEAKVKELEPQLVRIFFHEVQERNADQLASFYKTVELAQQAGATINITYHTAANAKFDPDRFMREFAVVLETLVKKGFSNVRWVTIQNEVNTTFVLPEQYNALYRELHDELVSRGLRDQIGLMGGDLVENGPTGGTNPVPNPNHKFWWKYMAEHMSDILDAYSVHIYWDYWDLQRMEFRLRSVREIVDGPLVAGARKPLYVTEFGVRGLRNYAGNPVIQPGAWADGTPLSRTNIAAFQHLWFDIASAQLGYSGAVKWDAYWGRYTPGYRETYNLIGPADEGWPLFPAYHALKLLFQTTARGWQVVRVDPWADDDWALNESGDPFDEPEKELAAYVGADDQLTVMGLDSHGRGLNAVSADPAAEYSIGGLPANATFNLALWNANGNGETSLAGTIETGPAGVARFKVPLHAAFSLTTVPVSYREGEAVGRGHPRRPTTASVARAGARRARTYGTAT